MIDGFRSRRPQASLRPIDQEHRAQMVIGDHAGSVQQPAAAPADNAAEPTPPSTPPNALLLPAQTKGSFKEWLHGVTKKQWIIASCIALLLVASGVTSFLLLHHKAAPVAVHTVKKAAIKPKVEVVTTVPSTLTGLPVDPSVNQRPVTGVMIENSTFARPQSGLDQAGVVFEAVAEGGITRFLALFQDTTPGYLGPVRSLRPYYIQWAQGFDAAIAHVGGSPEALNDMKTWGVKDLDQFYNSGSYHRIGSRDAPHNVYTSLAELNTLESNKGIGAANYSGFVRKKEQPAPSVTARGIDFTISYSDYNVHYDYDPATNTYKRSEGGAPHMEVDQNGNQTQIAPKVVVALVMNQGIEADDLHTSYTTIGSGHMFVFQDGLVTEGTWTKTAGGSQFTFTDGSGQPLKLNVGQAWFTIVSASNHVAYKP